MADALAIVILHLGRLPCDVANCRQFGDHVESRGHRHDCSKNLEHNGGEEDPDQELAALCMSFRVAIAPASRLAETAELRMAVRCGPRMAIADSLRRVEYLLLRFHLLLELFVSGFLHEFLLLFG